MDRVSHLTICSFDNNKNYNYTLLQTAILTQIEELKANAGALTLHPSGNRALILSTRMDSELQRLSVLAQQSSGKLDEIIQGRLLIVIKSPKVSSLTRRVI